MMLVILFLILCQNLKHKSWTLKGSKWKGGLRGRKTLERFVPQGARVCVYTWMYAHKQLPIAPHSVLAYSISAPISRSQWGPWPKSSFAPSKESWEIEGMIRTMGHLGPQPAILWKCSQLSWETWESVIAACPLLRQDGCLQPLHLCTPPSPLWKLCLSY